LPEIVLSRSLAELVRHPLPFAPLWLLQGFELLTWCVAVALIVWRRCPAALQVALALALLSRTWSDVPAFALFFILAALLCLTDPPPEPHANEA
jgi:hypothetical protein